MLDKLKKSNSEGFTIIEVMIVLAIAGLILLIVFLAVPALQRNARNTQRGTDIGSIVGAINEYVDNQGGTVPATCTGATPCPFLSNAKTGYYGSGGWTATNFIYTNNGGTAPAAATGDPANTNNIVAASYMSCNQQGTAAVVGTGPRNIAVLYDVETGGSTGGMQPECKTAQ
jgi:prepilin-type N-terminal cleavage/methylation domain-containing protein